MRLRRLTEAECYARCYGGLRSDQVSIVRSLPSSGDRATVVVRRLPERANARQRPREEAA